MKKQSLWPVAIAIIFAALAGIIGGTEAQILGVKLYAVYDFLGGLFIRALTLVVVPLVASSIIAGLARMGSDGSMGRIGAKIFGIFAATNFLAILVGALVINLFQPGGPEIVQQMKAMQESGAMPKMDVASSPSLFDMLNQIVPGNAIDAFGKGQMLAIIFFSLLFGYSLSRVPEQKAAPLVNAVLGLFETMLQMTHVIMKFLTLGVFCLVAKVFATIGLDSLRSAALFFVSVVSGLLFFAGVVLPLILKFAGGLRPLRHVSAMQPALITAFSTGSSSATLPVTMECLEKNAGVSNRICSLVAPLGTSLNMAGSGLFICAAVLFVAQAYGLPLTLERQAFVVFMTFVASCGVAGIPSACLVSALLVLKVMGVPGEGIGLFLAVDRILDMCRTTVNVFTDTCSTVLIAKSEGEHVLRG